MLPFIHKLLNHGSDEGNRGSKWQITLYLVPLGLSDKSDFSLIKRLSNVVGLEDTECLHIFSLLPYFSQWDGEEMWKTRSEKILGVQ